MRASDNFYEALESFNKFENFVEKKWYKEVPHDWFVAVSDVEGSTREINSGRYKEVNAVGVATIAAVLNAIKPLKIPFVFGGDGAVFCFPSSFKDKIASALLAAKTMARNGFEMNLRVGIVPITDIIEGGFKVKTAKYQPTQYYQQTMFIGRGISFAEELVKSKITQNKYLIDESKIQPEGSFEGYECRWNEIPSPHEETISLLVQLVDYSREPEELYNEIAAKISTVYGNEESHHPIRKELLSLTFSFKKLFTEAAIRTALKHNLKRIFYILKLMVLNLSGKWLMYKKKKTTNTDWGKYKESLITNTDFRKFDDALRMVISGTKVQRARLVFYLEQLRLQNKIVYGIHSSPASLITCLVDNYETEHVHFLDGAEGGYALAAIQLKKQLAELK